MKMNARGREGSIQRDDLELTAHPCWQLLTRTAKGGLRQIADDPKNKATELLLHRQLRQSQMKILTGRKL